MGPRFTVIEFTLIVLAPHICAMNNYVNNVKLHYVIDAIPNGAITVQLPINPVTLQSATKQPVSKSRLRLGQLSTSFQFPNQIKSNNGILCLCVVQSLDNAKLSEFCFFAY